MADFARGELIRKLREDLHLSQEEAAHRIGVSVKTIRAWEKGGKIRWPNAKSAGKVYSVDPEELVTRDEGGPSIAEVAQISPSVNDDEAVELLHQVLDQQGELLELVRELHADRERQRRSQGSDVPKRAATRKRKPA